MRKLTLILPALLLAIAFVPFSMAAEDPQPEDGLDSLIPVAANGRVEQTKIIKEDYLYVIGKHKIDIKRKSCDVKEITYGDQDSSFQSGITNRDDGKYRVAAFHFLKSLENLKGKTRIAWPAEYCNYQIANALYQEGLFKGFTGKTGTVYAPASEYYKQALAANARSRFLPDIVSKIPYCLSEEDKLDEAEAAVKDGAAKIKAFREEGVAIAPAYADIAEKASAQLALADAKIVEKRTDKAGAGANLQDVVDRWHLARTKSDKFPELQAEAVDGELQAMVRMKNYDGVIAEAQTLIDKYKQTGDSKVLPLLPGAYTALGKSFLGKAADYEGRKNLPQALNSYAEARWQFINVVAQFFDKDEYVANAHYLAGFCYNKLKDIEPDAAEKAQRHWKLVVNNFPKSAFKDLADKALADAGVATDKKDDEKKDDVKKDEVKKDAPKDPKETKDAPPKTAPKDTPKKGV